MTGTEQDNKGSPRPESQKTYRGNYFCRYGWESKETDIRLKGGKPSDTIKSQHNRQCTGPIPGIHVLFKSHPPQAEKK